MRESSISSDRKRRSIASRARTTLVLFLVLLLLAEIIVANLNPYRRYSTASETPRNPLPLRGWPEYLREGAGTSDVNVAIISNSQGVGLELADPAGVYSHLLEQRLVGRGRDINVENWSVSGLRSDQVELLSMTAAHRQLDLLVIVTEIKSIDIAGTTRLGANADDLDLVAGNPVYWPMIRNSPLLQDTDWDDLLRRFFTLNSAIVRLRPYAMDRLAAVLPPALHHSVFGHRRSRYALSPTAGPQTNRGSDTPRDTGTSVVGIPAGDWERQFRRNRVPTFEMLFRSIHPRLRDADTALLWIWMPIYPGEVTSALRRGGRPVYRDLCAKMSSAGVQCVDMTESLPAASFVTASASSHLNPAGHQAMAELLLPLIEDAIY